nr:hypothetical protein [Paraburkholderia mimosarum]
MKKTKPFYRGHRFLSLRDVEELMLEPGVVVTYETISVKGQMVDDGVDQNPAQQFYSLDG